MPDHLCWYPLMSFISRKFRLNISRSVYFRMTQIFWICTCIDYFWVIAGVRISWTLWLSHNRRKLHIITTPNMMFFGTIDFLEHWKPNYSFVKPKNYLENTDPSSPNMLFFSLVYQQVSKTNFPFQMLVSFLSSVETIDQSRWGGGWGEVEEDKVGIDCEKRRLDFKWWTHNTV